MSHRSTAVPETPATSLPRHSFPALRGALPFAAASAIDHAMNTRMILAMNWWRTR
jgi:hypothetical protein